MPNEGTKVYTASLPAALLADLEECAANQHRSFDSILCSAVEVFIRAWRATQSQEYAEFIASLTAEDLVKTQPESPRKEAAARVG
jgi:hypothetical protein